MNPSKTDIPIPQAFGGTRGRQPRPYRSVGGQAPVEAGDPAEHLLAVPVQLLQLVLDEHGIQGLTLLNQLLPKHDELVDLVGI